MVKHTKAEKLSLIPRGDGGGVGADVEGGAGGAGGEAEHGRVRSRVAGFATGVVVALALLGVASTTGYGGGLRANLGSGQGAGGDGGWLGDGPGKAAHSSKMPAYLGDSPTKGRSIVNKEGGLPVGRAAGTTAHPLRQFTISGDVFVFQSLRGFIGEGETGRCWLPPGVPQSDALSALLRGVFKTNESTNFPRSIAAGKVILP